jgi:RNA recognition motif-containing protein
LKEFFMSNKVRAIKVVIFKNEKNESKGTGIVEFSSSQDAEYVVKNLNGTDIDGVTCSFNFDRGSQGGAAGGFGRGKY